MKEPTTEYPESRNPWANPPWFRKPIRTPMSNPLLATDHHDNFFDRWPNTEPGSDVAKSAPRADHRIGAGSQFQSAFLTRAELDDTVDHDTSLYFCAEWRTSVCGPLAPAFSVAYRMARWSIKTGSGVKSKLLRQFPSCLFSRSCHDNRDCL